MSFFIVGGSGGGQGVGYAQTWSDVIGSRNFGVTYTNSGSSPRTVSIECWNANGIGGEATVATFLIDGNEAFSFNGNTDNQYMTQTAIVPPGKTYQLVNTSGGGQIPHWWELQ